MKLYYKKNLIVENKQRNIKNDYSLFDINKMNSPNIQEKYDITDTVIENKYLNDEPNKLVIDLLRDIKKLQIDHNIHAATKEQLTKHDNEIKGSITSHSEELKNTIMDMQLYIDKLSVSNRLTNISLIAIIISIIFFVINLIDGKIVIQSPMPEYILLASIFFYFIAKSFSGKSK